ncbi:DUF6089 family protein [Fulvivirga ligni]|uniref:DUF6089 family protein n=1 Tax=Fulvivirga ligni TaxID=2904246 RepID=UPI001F476ABF|nr:DUF6089 family protein [Fulvivirga ligni]UII22758.1 DUF6089 family protein [Fulvivirga ligni]
MKKLFVIAFCAFLYLISVQDVSAQIRSRKIKKNNKRISNYRGRKNTFGKEKRYNYVGVSLNAFNYFGDLAPLPSKLSTDISFTKPGIGIFYGHRFGPRYSLRASFTYGTVSGNDYESADPNDDNAKFRYVRNLHFRNRIKELTVVAVFDLVKNESSYISRAQITPYVFGGLTVFHHNPQAYVPEDSGFDEAGTWIDLQPLGTEGQYADLQPGDVNESIKPYKNIQIAIPLGIGVRYRLNQVVDISFETGMRYLFTDYLDDVSQNYVNPSRFTGENADLARYMSDLSQYPNDPVSGNARDLSNPEISEIMNNTYEVDGVTKIRGYGSESRDNMRGNSNEKDLYFVSTFKVAFIIGASFRRAKFR